MKGRIMRKFARLLVIPVLVLSGAAKCNTATPAPQSTIRPAPNADPAHPRPGQRTFPGNVRITFWVEQEHERTVIAYNVGVGYQSKTGHRPGIDWSETVKPNQFVTVTVAPFIPGAVGRIFVQVIQDNNGRIICHDDNSSPNKSINYHGGASCSGTVII